MILLELVVGVELDGHSPGILVDTAHTEAEGMVVALHFIEVDAAQVSGIDGSVAPEQHRTAILVPLADDRCGSLYVGGDVPYVTLRDTLKVAQPEEHTVWFDIGCTLDVVEAHELSCRIGLV